jgi:hypothetical protein
MCWAIVMSMGLTRVSGASRSGRVARAPSIRSFRRELLPTHSRKSRPCVVPASAATDAGSCSLGLAMPELYCASERRCSITFL